MTLRLGAMGALCALYAAVVGLGYAAHAEGRPAVVIDTFEPAGEWTAHPADGVALSVALDSDTTANAMRLDFDFAGGGGWAVVRREVDLDLPENYAFSFRLRGAAPVNNLEFKLIDASGENVWWFVRRDFEFRDAWETLTIKKRHVAFAWGPQGGGDIRHVAAIEIAITAGSGGSGQVWIGDLKLTPLAAPHSTPLPAVATASSGDGRAALDGNPTTSWSTDRRDENPMLVLDLGEVREYGGLSLDWLADRHPATYAIDISDDGKVWQVVRSVEFGNGGRDDLFLPETESRYVRLRASGQTRAIALRDIVIRDLSWSESREAFFLALAADAERGCYPRAFSGEQAYWTVVGVDADTEELLFGEDGAIETGKAAFSIEPFLYTDGKLITWNDVTPTQSLESGFLPIPSVTWNTERFELTVTPFAFGEPGASSVVVRYRVANHGTRRARLTLFLALRPFQVNPPTQFLNTRGGTARIEQLALVGRSVHANGREAFVSLTEPTGFGAAAFDAGDIVCDYLVHGRIPQQRHVVDDFGAASGVIEYGLDLGAGVVGEVDLMIPLHDSAPVPSTLDRWVDDTFRQQVDIWRQRAEQVTIELPECAADIEQTLQSQLGYVLVNRAGAAIQPGARAYARSWIRDGALTSSALLRLGHFEPVRDFLAWFASYQYDDGKIPCCVDERGADPVPEHDSGGEFIFLVAEYYRYARDREHLADMWPRVQRAVDYLDALRHERRTPEFQQPGKEEFFGLLPPSISHEGYSAKPMHSYWDDFFALRGFKDAAWMAGELGLYQEHARLSTIRDEFQADLVASIAATMDRHGIDYVPGCADLGDFDPTSTTIALAPVGADDVLPQAWLARTFERYDAFFRTRQSSDDWEVYTPYELRNVGAFVRLGWRERAHELLEFFLEHRRPLGWKHWAEVVARQPRQPRFIGDMPHTWVGSDYIRSVLDMLCYVSEAQQALIVGAGIPSNWLRDDKGVVVRNLPTPYGRLHFSMRATDEGIEINIGGSLNIPQGGIVVDPPVLHLVRAIRINGRIVASDDRRLVVRELPANIVLLR